MNRIFKTWILWLLVLALPAQGYAAVSQLSCGPLMHQTVTEVTHDTSMHHAVAHEHHAQILPADMGMTAGQDAHADATHVQTHEYAHEQQASSTCSACAACCLSIAMLPALPDWSITTIGATPVVSAPASLFLGHIADGLKRPPKSLRV